MTYNFKGREIVDLEVEDINTADYPDFCDAYVSHAVWKDTGIELTVEEIEEYNDTCSDQVYDAVMKRVF
jgi:hypothetical protein